MMKCRWLLLAIVLMSGCAGFDEYDLDGYTSYPSGPEPTAFSAGPEPPCGCQSGPRPMPARLPVRPAAAPVWTPVGNVPSGPQSREPELIR